MAVACVASGLLDDNHKLSAFVWALLIFVGGLLSASYQMYRKFRIAVGTGLKLMPDVTLDDLVREIMAEKYALLDAEPIDAKQDSVGRLTALLTSIRNHAALNNITIWGKVNAVLQEVPPGFWAKNKIGFMSYLSQRPGQTEPESGIHTRADGNIYRDLYLNSQQIKYVRKAWKGLCFD